MQTKKADYSPHTQFYIHPSLPPLKVSYENLIRVLI